MARRLKVLKVDLTNQKTTVDLLGEDISRRFIGGRGVAAYLLYGDYILDSG